MLADNSDVVIQGTKVQEPWRTSGQVQVEEGLEGVLVSVKHVHVQRQSLVGAQQVHRVVTVGTGRQARSHVLRMATGETKRNAQSSGTLREASFMSK